MDRAANEADAAKRLAILSEAERLVVEEDLPFIPIFQYVQVYLFDPHKVSGISSHPRQQQDLFRVDILGDGKGSDKPLALPPGGGAVKRKQRAQRKRQQRNKATDRQMETNEEGEPSSAMGCGRARTRTCCSQDGGVPCSA
jgi:hypothetical protein